MRAVREWVALKVAPWLYVPYRADREEAFRLLAEVAYGSRDAVWTSPVTLVRSALREAAFREAAFREARTDLYQEKRVQAERDRRSAIGCTCPVHYYWPIGGACCVSAECPLHGVAHKHSFPLSTGVCVCGAEHPTLGPARSS